MVDGSGSIGVVDGLMVIPDRDDRMLSMERLQVWIAAIMRVAKPVASRVAVSRGGMTLRISLNPYS